MKQSNSYSTALTDSDRIHILLEEFRVLYSLLTFRLGAMDRRLPVAGGTLIAVLGSLAALPRQARLSALLAMPAVLVWFLRTTISHSRSKEDVLRRLDEVERAVNQIAGEELLVFQSRHPNRHRAVGGRTGLGIVSTVFGFCFASLAGCVVAWVRQLGTVSPFLPAYGGYALVAGLDLIACMIRVRRYRYVKSPPEASPLFRAWGLPERPDIDPVRSILS